MILLISPPSKSESKISEEETFSSVFDIGKKIGLRKISLDDFVRYERAMVAAATLFMFHGNDLPRINLLETERSSLKLARKQAKEYGLDRILLKNIPSIGTELGVNDFQDLIRLVLRECIWLSIESKDRYLHFGYDLYVYFSGKGAMPKAISELKNSGMKLTKLKKLPIGHGAH